MICPVHSDWGHGHEPVAYSVHVAPLLLCPGNDHSALPEVRPAPGVGPFFDPVGVGALSHVGYGSSADFQPGDTWNVHAQDRVRVHWTGREPSPVLPEPRCRGFKVCGCFLDVLCHGKGYGPDPVYGALEGSPYRSRVRGVPAEVWAVVDAAQDQVAVWD